MIEFVLLGAFGGIIAGLIPGIHTNLVAVMVACAGFDAWFSCLFLASLASSRSIIDAVPTVFLGASSDVMSLHPAHRFLKKGFGLVGVRILVSGALAGLIVSFLLAPFLFIVLPFLQNLVKPVLFWLLLGVVIFLVLREGARAFVVFSISGVLGYISLSAVTEPLFPLLSGLFGASGLILSLFDGFDVPLQKTASNPNIPISRLSLFAILGVCLSGFLMLFPGLGPSQAASLVRVKSKTRYLLLTGALGTVDVIISLVAFVSIGRARNGAVAVMEQLVGSFDISALIALIGACCFSAGIAGLASVPISKWYSSIFDFVEYRFVALGVLFFLCVLSLTLSGLLGLLIFAVSAIVGLLAPLLGVSRSHAMGCLLVPTLLMLW
ncbi:tripartite tricarboxylate transporter permease [Candidatus Woesearchaeota archaeon]|nr:tripartite tricarboxylate transporter permease [Candidatus Woesearchaeota archaeon]